MDALRLDKQDSSTGYQDFPGFTGCLIKLKSTIWLAKDNPKPKPSKPSQREVPNPALHAILRPLILFPKTKNPVHPVKNSNPIEIYIPYRGAFLENFVYLELRRHTADLSYFSEQGHECDFIVDAHAKVPLCLQVCRDLNSDNEAREIGGLIAALDFFNTKIGYLITGDTRDTLLQSSKRIELIPAHSVDFQDISTG